MLDPARSYDLIGDVHGCALTLEHLLDRLGYKRQGGVWRHPSRMAVFVGDIIDRAVVLSDGRLAHDGPLGDLGQHHRRLGGHEHLDHGRTADDHDDGAESWLGGAVEP